LFRRFWYDNDRAWFKGFKGIAGDFFHGRIKIKTVSIVVASLFIVIISCGGKPFTPPPEKESLVVLSPAGNEVFFAGDTIHIRWEYKNSADSVFRIVPHLSKDNGKTFKNLFTRDIIGKTPVSDTFWIVPTDTTLLTELAVVQVYDYSKITLVGKSNFFSIRKMCTFREF
jgi:hypothetical protein